ncbi:MAG TPA: polyphosphate kinase 1 [Flavobacteriaceae bacterium]|nr:polyphosphate kinase 1 [Flavobacteriaceae bacterium]
MKYKERYKNREISWLQFNARVLQEAADERVPLLERLRFLGIFSNNLDEFFKVRYAAVKRIQQAGRKGKNFLGGFEADALMKRITDIVIQQQNTSLEILHKIHEDLKSHNIFIINEEEVSETQAEFVKNYFLEKVSPALATILLTDFDKIPKLKDNMAYLAVKMILNKNASRKKKFFLIEIPLDVERFVVLPSEDERKYVIILDDLIRYNLKSYFSIFDYKTLSAHMIKITRDAELDIDGDLNKSYIAQLMASVQGRVEGQTVRFVYDEQIEDDILQFLLSQMKIDDFDSIIPGGRYHNRRDYMKFPNLGAKELLYPTFQPLPIAGLKIEGSLLKQIWDRDFLQYVPYHTFSYTVRFLREAAIDPKVKSIKITIYRMAEFSNIAGSLINAVRNGKKVTAVIELRARFDEANNIHYAEVLQREGVQLIFGVRGLKVHSKTCVIARKEGNNISRYGFVSTGNLNENTAKVYTDYCLFTANQEILKDVDKLFDFFETNYKVQHYKHLIVSPHHTRNRFEKLIDTEIGNAQKGLPANIKIKVNSLSDYKMIDKLYEASNAGVKIQLIVRGICSLLPGVQGLSENIEAISIVDRYLEHPRLFIFENAGAPKYFISSADLMMRNLDDRVEVTCPIYQKDIQQELSDTFNICWNDNVKARDFSAEIENAYRVNDLQEEVRSQFVTYDYYKNKLNQN